MKAHTQTTTILVDDSNEKKKLLIKIKRECKKKKIEKKCQ